MQPTYAITDSPASRHYGSPRVSLLRRRDDAARPALRRQSLVLNGTGILTCFPFGVLELRYVLGPTNPRLTIIAEETWPLRRQGFSPCFAATITRIFVCERSTGLYSPASARTQRLSTRLLAVLRGIGSRLEPRQFSGAQTLDW